MVEFSTRIRGTARYRKTLSALASRILNDSGRADAVVSVLLTDDGQITELNRQYRGQDRPTDVLSFSQLDGERAAFPGPAIVLGDVVISVDRATAQAREAGTGLEEELKRLLAHGILHLLGHDHEGSAGEARAMRRLEERYLEET